MFEQRKSWLRQATIWFANQVEALWILIFGFEINWEKLESRSLWETLQANKAWFQNQAKLLVSTIVVAMVIISSWMFAMNMAAKGDIILVFYPLELFAMGAFAVGSMIGHKLIAGRTWWRSFILTVIELAAWWLGRVVAHNWRYYFMLTPFSITLRLAVAWFVGIIAWLTRSQWTTAVDSFSWRMRQLAGWWQALYIFPGVNIILNGMVTVAMGSAVFLAVRNPWTFAILLPILFVWLASALLTPPTQQEIIQRAQKLEAQKAAARGEKPPAAVRPEDSEEANSPSHRAKKHH